VLDRCRLEQERRKNLRKIFSATVWFSLLGLILMLGIALTSCGETQSAQAPNNTKVKAQPKESNGQKQQSSSSLYSQKDGNILWSGNFETGNFSNWEEVHQGGKWGNSSATIVTSPVPPGFRYSVKLEVIPTGHKNNRVELSASQQATGGYDRQEWYYSWSFYAPSNPNATSGWAQTNITQWMDLLYQCSPPEQIDIMPGNPPHLDFHSELRDNSNGCAHIGPTQDWDLGPMEYDKWNNITVHLKFSADPAVGFAEIWVNGNNVLPFTHVRTLDTSGGVYMEQAIYHPGEGGPHILYLDGTRRHDKYSGANGNT
jgi:hypothetical protein